MGVLMATAPGSGMFMVCVGYCFALAVMGVLGRGVQPKAHQCAAQVGAVDGEDSDSAWRHNWCTDRLCSCCGCAVCAACTVVGNCYVLHKSGCADGNCSWIRCVDGDVCVGYCFALAVMDVLGRGVQPNAHRCAAKVGVLKIGAVVSRGDTSGVCVMKATAAVLHVSISITCICSL
jgi:hypothetical protein